MSAFEMMRFEVFLLKFFLGGMTLFGAFKHFNNFKLILRKCFQSFCYVRSWFYLLVSLINEVWINQMILGPTILTVMFFKNCRV